MSKKMFTAEEIEQLSANPYVKSVSSKGITYTKEFKQLFITSNQQGKLPRDIFMDCGFDVQIVGMKRIESSGKRWRASYREQGALGLQDAVNLRHPKEQHDEAVKHTITKAFHFKKRKRGARSIKMILEGQFQVVYNLKRIRRIMKKYGMVCPFRRANPYKRMLKATQEHRTLPNLLKRNFKQEVPGKVLLTDITYLVYGKGQRAYLSTIKDGSTNEILAYHVSERITMDLATETLLKLKKNRSFKKTSETFIHSDQGTHYTHPDFQEMVNRMGFKQSMSRRGNYWDNAPQESFFGHLKDEVFLKTCTTLDEVKREIKSYMTYYNHYRYQWNLKRMTPVQYRDHLLQAI